MFRLLELLGELLGSMHQKVLEFQTETAELSGSGCKTFDVRFPETGTDARNTILFNGPNRPNVHPSNKCLNDQANIA